MPASKALHLRLVGDAPTNSSPPPQAPGLDDSALLARMVAADPSAAQGFCDRVRPIVDRTLTRLLGASDNDYEDVAQVALVELVDTIDRFRRDCPLDAWVSIVTARVVYRHLRRRRVERRLFSPFSQQLADASVRALPPATEVRQALERVGKLVAEVDPQRAWTWLLHDVYGYALKEITEIMGVSLSAAQTRLVRGRREVHARLRQDEVLAAYMAPAGQEQDE